MTTPLTPKEEAAFRARFLPEAESYHARSITHDHQMCRVLATLDAERAARREAVEAEARSQVLSEVEQAIRGLDGSTPWYAGEMLDEGEDGPWVDRDDVLQAIGLLDR